MTSLTEKKINKCIQKFNYSYFHNKCIRLFNAKGLHYCFLKEFGVVFCIHLIKSEKFSIYNLDF